MKKSTLPQLLLLIVTLLGSLIGFFVRRAQLANELLSDGSLAPGSYLHIVLTVLTFVLLAAFFALLLPLRRLTGYRAIFTAAPLLNGLQLVAAVGLVCGNVLLWIQGREPTTALATQSPVVSGALSAMLAPLGLLSAVCIAAFALLRLSGKKPSALLYMLASVYLVVRLIVCFQEWNTDPSIHDYCFQLLAAICAMLSFFQLAGFCLNRGKRRISLFWCLNAIVFCSITVADTLAHGAMDELLVNASLLLSIAVSSVQLLFPRGPEEEPAK